MENVKIILYFQFVFFSKLLFFFEWICYYINPTIMTNIIDNNEIVRFDPESSTAT